MQVIGAPFSRLAGDRHRSLIYNPVDRNPQLVDSVLADLSEELGSFGTLDEQTACLAQGDFSHLSRDQIRALISEASELGLVITEEEARRALRRNATNTKPPPITSVVWATKNRRESIAESVRSWRAALRRGGRGARYVVADDTEKPAGGVPTSQHLHGTSIVIDRDATARLVRHLADRGIPEDVARFAFFGEEEYPGFRYGANRNRCIALTAGENILMLDDDTEPSSARSRKASDTPAFFGLVDPTELSYHHTDDEIHGLPEFVPDPVETDPLLEHESFLGRDLSSLFFESVGRVAPEVTSLDRELLKRFLSGHGTIRITQPGSYGATGTRHNKRLLHLAGSTRAYHGSEEAFVRAAASSRNWRRVRQPVLSIGSAFLTMAAGIDNTTMVPPFCPVGRGVDWIWSTTFHCCDSILLAYLPICIHHLGAPTPPDARQDALGTYRLFFADAFRMIIQGVAGTPGSGQGVEAALIDLGRRLETLGTRTWDELLDVVGPRWIAEMEATRDRLDDLLVYFEESPPSWSKTVRAFLEGIERYPAESQFGIPWDLPGRQKDCRRDQESLLRLVRRYGLLLQVWPDIRRGCHEFGGTMPF